MTSARDDYLKLEAYRTALQARNLEINLFWQRSNYFLVLNTAIAIGFFSRDEKDAYAVLLSLVGVVVAILWVLVNLGSKFWQSRWEYRLELVEKELQEDMKLFSADWLTVRDDVQRSLDSTYRRKWLFGEWLSDLYKGAVLIKPSVSKVMTALSVFFVLFWLVTLLFSIAACE